MSLEGPQPGPSDSGQHQGEGSASPQASPGAAPVPRPESSPEQLTMPPPSTAKPLGQILTISGTHQSTWVAPEWIRPYPGFGSWLTKEMKEEIAALDALVVTFPSNPSFSKDGQFHLEVPGNPPSYLTFKVEKRSGEAAPAKRSEDEFACLLLRLTTLTAHPVFLKSSAVPPEDRRIGTLT